MDTELLQELGLTINEVKTYLALLEIGQSLAGTVAEESRVHRRNVYDVLKRLTEKGLVAHVVKANRKYYEAVSPEKIISMLKEKLDIAEIALPELLSKYNASKSRQEVQVLQGIGGMKTFYNDMHKENKNIYMIGATGKAYTELKYFIPPWIKKMNKLGIEIYALWNSDSINREYFIRELKSKSKILPRNFSTPTQVYIYGDKSVVTVWAKEPLATLIKSKEIAEGFKKYFDFMWGLSKDVII